LSNTKASWNGRQAGSSIGSRRRSAVATVRFATADELATVLAGLLDLRDLRLGDVHAAMVSAIVPTLAHSYEPWKFLNYHMSYTEVAILLGSFGWFFMWFLLFLRFLPGLSIAEIKEVLPPPMRHHEAEKHAQDEREMVTETLPSGYKEFEQR
jgi:hypothetical protein